MVKDVGMTVPKSRETSAVYMQQDIYACYYCCMPSSPVLLHIILPSSPVLLHIYCTCSSTFWHCYPYILHHFNGNVLLPCFTGFSLHRYSLANTMLFAFVRAPPHFAARGHVVCTCVTTRKWRSTTRKC